MRCLKKEVFELKNKVNKMEQAEKEKNLLISGIHQRQGEDIISVVEKIATSLEVNLRNTDVTEAHRVNSKNMNSPILVKFSNKNIRDEMLLKKKEKKLLHTEQCGFSQDGNQMIFINEDLTKENQELFKGARELKKNGKIKYTWVSGGKIFIRKGDGTEAKRVMCENDLR